MHACIALLPPPSPHPSLPHTPRALLGCSSHASHSRGYGSPGTNNAHEVRSRSARSLMHSDSSVLERHHLHSTFTLLLHPPVNIFSALSTEAYALVRKLMIDMVLATDLSRHFEYLTRLRHLAAEHASPKSNSSFNNKAAGGSFKRTASFKGAVAGSASGSFKRTASFKGALAGSASGSLNGASGLSASWRTPFLNPELVDTPLLLATAIKFADLGHSFKRVEQHQQWTEKVTEEFWLLGDRERSSGMGSISPLCDRRTDTNLPKMQIGFFSFVCNPFYSVVADLIDPNMLPWQRVRTNLSMWQDSRKES